MATVELPDVVVGKEKKRDMAIATLVLQKRITIEEAASRLGDKIKEVDNNRDQAVDNKMDDVIQGAN